MGAVLVGGLIVGGAFFLASRFDPGSTENTPALSAPCEAAVKKAIADEAWLYDNHPLWAAEIPAIDASDEEWASYHALTADEEAQWTAAWTPVYDTCNGPAEWWAAAQAYPLVAGVTSADVIAPADILTWCYGWPDSKACVGAQEWVDAQG